MTFLAACIIAAFVQGPTVVSLEQKLSLSSAVQGDEFGARIKIYADWAAISAVGEEYDRGAVHMYERVGTTWIFRQRLSPPANLNQCGFGIGLALDGTTLLVGAPRASSAGTFSGTAWVYTLSAGVWSLQAELLPADVGALDLYGEAVALSGDTAAVGCPFDDTAVSQSGSAYVFRRNGTTWTQEAKLVASDAAVADRFGRKLDLEGDTLVVTAPSDDGPLLNSGSAYVFSRTGATWAQFQKLNCLDPNTGQDFGESVDLLGTRLVLGARGDDHAGYNTGAVYVFELAGTNWIQASKLVADLPSASDGFGCSVTTYGDIIGIGAWHDSQGSSSSGAAYLFQQVGSGWQQMHKLKPSDLEANDEFGLDCTLFGDTFGVGTFHDDVAAIDSGSAYVYRILAQPVVYCTALTNSLGCLPQIAFSGLPSMSQPLPFDVSVTEVISNKLGLFFYSVNGRASVPFFGGTLCVVGPVRRTVVQFSAGSVAANDCAGAFHFDFNAHAQSGSDSGLEFGVVVGGQYWYRDPQAAATTGLSDAVEFELGP